MTTPKPIRHPPSLPPERFCPLIETYDMLYVGLSQRGNAVLTHFPPGFNWKFANMMPDFIFGEGKCAIYLSIQFHLLHPKYIFDRMRDVVASVFPHRFLILRLDVEEYASALAQLTAVAVDNEWVLLVATSTNDLLQWILSLTRESLRPESSVQQEQENTRPEDALTTIPTINKTDAALLLQAFGSVADIANASMEELSLVRGLGENKLRHLVSTFRSPLRPTQEAGDTEKR